MSWVRFWETDPRPEAALLGRHAARGRSVAIAPDGEIAASAVRIRRSSCGRCGGA